MNFCKCGGELVRHGITYYKRQPDMIGIRYKCLACNSTFTKKMKDDTVTGTMNFNATGRPTLKDWRYA